MTFEYIYFVPALIIGIILILIIIFMYQYVIIYILFIPVILGCFFTITIEGRLPTIAAH